MPLEDSLEAELPKKSKQPNKKTHAKTTQHSFFQGEMMRAT